MALTEKGKIALAHIKKYFPSGAFNAKDLSDACGEKIVAATLNGVANAGYITKLGGSPVEYESCEILEELISALEEEKKGCDASNLRAAKANKNDEFYTRYDDIEAEVMKYRKQFVDKTIYLPCDDPVAKKSEFWNFFANNFEAFGLKKLIATYYDEHGKSYKIWIDGDTTGDGFIDGTDAVHESLKGNGDFRSPECEEILKESDIVITNPPFSLFREFIDWIMKHNKQFLIIGSQNAFGYKNVFPLIKDNKIWVGYNMVQKFYQPNGSIKEFGNICWFTNLPTKRRNEELILTEKYSEALYPKYDNYDAIEVGALKNIPKDYTGLMGVPITFIDKYNPNQFEIIGMTAYSDKNAYGIGSLYVNKHKKYSRVIIRKKQ